MKPQWRQIQRSGEKECSFCGKSQINDNEWGDMYELGDVSVHYFCMLFSEKLKQEGKDEEGIWGFLPYDLKKEIRRGEMLECEFCNGHGATIHCVEEECETNFHFPCALAQGTLFQFKNFESLCPTHKPKCNIPKDKYDSDCLLCFSNVSSDEPAVWPTCCKKNIYHRLCMQKYAAAAGLHHFSCPCCREKDKFISVMQESGVFVPDRDAVWERDKCFAELEYVYANCDAPRCVCPHGRKYDASKVNYGDELWRIARCKICAAKAVHFKCGNLKLQTWKCMDCISVITRVSPVVVEDDEVPSEDSHLGCDEDVPEVAADLNTNGFVDLKKAKNRFDFTDQVLPEIEKIRDLVSKTSNGKDIFKSALAEWASKLRQPDNNSSRRVGSALLTSGAHCSSNGNGDSLKRKLENLRRPYNTSEDEILAHAIKSPKAAGQNMRSALQKFREEKNVNPLKRTFIMEEKTPKFADPPKALKKVGKVAPSPLSSKAKSSGGTKKILQKLPPTSSYDGNGKDSNLSDHIKNRVAQKFAQRLELMNSKSSSNQLCSKTESLQNQSTSSSLCPIKNKAAAAAVGSSKGSLPKVQIGLNKKNCDREIDKEMPAPERSMSSNPPEKVEKVKSCTVPFGNNSNSKDVSSSDADDSHSSIQMVTEVNDLDERLTSKAHKSKSSTMVLSDKCKINNMQKVGQKSQSENVSFINGSRKFSNETNGSENSDTKIPPQDKIFERSIPQSSHLVGYQPTPTVGRCGGFYVEESELRCCIENGFLGTSVIDTYAALLRELHLSPNNNNETTAYIPSTAFSFTGDQWVKAHYIDDLVKNIRSSTTIELTTVATIVSAGNHWMLFVANSMTGLIQIADTLNGYCNKTKLRDGVLIFVKLLSIFFGDKNWRMKYFPKIAKQTDSHSCGPASLYFLEQLYKNSEIQCYDPETYQYYRSTIVERILRSTDEGRKILQNENDYTKYIENSTITITLD